MKAEIGDNVRIITEGFTRYGHFLKIGDIVTVVDVDDTFTTVMRGNKIQVVEESDYKVIK